MARIAGVDLPNKHVDVALTYIFGIGVTSARKICAATGVDPEKRTNDLTADEVNKLRTVIENEYQVEGPPAHGGVAQHQAAHGHRVLPRHPPSPRPAGPRPADEDERAHPQGQAEDRRREEEEVVASAPGRETTRVSA